MCDNRRFFWTRTDMWDCVCLWLGLVLEEGQYNLPTGKVV